MSMSIQTNYASLVAADNLNTNSNFMTNTIEQLTSGYRINQSGDDPAGLAVANKYDSSIAELTQGVLNANDGTSQLQIADGGLSNITQMLNQLKTLATQSASTTFTGDRANINVEYQQLVTDISRQAANIGLNSGGQLNTLNNVYIGGGSNQSNAQVQIDLSGAQNTVDAAGLGIANTTVLGGGTGLTGNTVNLNNTAVTFLAGNANASQTFNFNIGTATGNSAVAVTVNGSVAGISGSDVVSQLNSALSAYGISASTASNGTLQFSGSTAFTVTTAAPAGGATAGTQVATTASTASNSANYTVNSDTALNGAGTAGGAFVAFAAGATGSSETISFQNAAGTTSITLSGTANGGNGNATTLTQALQTLNDGLAGTGISAVENAAGNGISFQSATSFNATLTANSTGGTGNLFGSGTAAAANADVGAITVTDPAATSSSTGNALAAITAIDSALTQLGDVQSVVGSGEMLLQYATDLANSQITNYSAAESRIKDADVATEAANLSKAQVLEQSSIAAMAQANSAPQALLKLLQ